MARIKRIYGEPVTMSTTAAHLAAPQGYTEIKHKSDTDYRLGLAPSIQKVFLYVVAGTYTDYTAYARDKSASTHVPLDAMATTSILYMGFSECPRGVYFVVDTHVNAEAATLDVEYCYDAAQKGYIKLTGTVSAALTVGETVTGGTSGVTATAVYDNGSTYLVVKNANGAFLTGETVSGATQNISAITAITNESEGTGYWTDVASDSDGTDSPGATLSKDGLYSWTLPASIPCTVNGVSGLHWIRFSPSAPLSAAVDVVQIIPACIDVNYGYFDGGFEYQYPIDTYLVGAIETDMASGTDTLTVTWIRT